MIVLIYNFLIMIMWLQVKNSHVNYDKTSSPVLPSLLRFPHNDCLCQDNDSWLADSMKKWMNPIPLIPASKLQLQQPLPVLLLPSSRYLPPLLANGMTFFSSTSPLNQTSSPFSLLLISSIPILWWQYYQNFSITPPSKPEQNYHHDNGNHCHFLLYPQSTSTSPQ